jgi:hypothetical protein
VAHHHRGGSEHEIRRALRCIGVLNVTPELIRAIREGKHPKARFSST